MITVNNFINLTIEKPFVIEVFGHTARIIGNYSFPYGCVYKLVTNRTIALFHVRAKGTPRPPETADKWPVEDTRWWPCDSCDNGVYYPTWDMNVIGQQIFKCINCGDETTRLPGACGSKGR